MLIEVQELGQPDNRISTDGASKLATALRHNTSLLTLDLSGGAICQGYRVDVIDLSIQSPQRPQNAGLSHFVGDVLAAWPACQATVTKAVDLGPSLTW